MVALSSPVLGFDCAPSWTIAAAGLAESVQRLPADDADDGGDINDNYGDVDQSR